MNKFCPKCKIEKEPCAFDRDSTREDGLRWLCKACRRVYRQMLRERNPEKYKEIRKLNRIKYKEKYKESAIRYARRASEKARERNVRIKKEVLTHYGNGKLACIQCAFDDIRALSIDHINNDGAEHRRKLGMRTGGLPFYVWLIKADYPQGYQTLCMNCQWIKKHGK